MKRLALLALTALLATACDIATKPTDIRTAPLGAQKVQAPTRNTATLGPANGQGSATNHEDGPGWFTFIAWDFADGTNQIDVARFSRDAAPGQTVDASVAWDDSDPCKTWQVDIYWNMPKAERYTINDTLNYPPVASRIIHPRSACRLPPSEPIPPPPPSCPPPLTFTFPAGSYIARFPADVVPFYPSEVGPFAFAVPAGLYRVTAVTGDEHGRKDDGPQDERGNIVTDAAQSIGPTNDVPDDADVAFTDFGVLPVAAFGSFRFVHAVTGPVDSATDSFYPVSLTFTCVDPQAARAR